MRSLLKVFENIVVGFDIHSDKRIISLNYTKSDQTTALLKAITPIKWSVTKKYLYCKDMPQYLTVLDLTMSPAIEANACWRNHYGFFIGGFKVIVQKGGFTRSCFSC